MDRIRNAGHFAARLQRWLEGTGAPIRQAEPQVQAPAGMQIDQLAPDAAAELTAALADVLPPAPLVRVPETAPLLRVPEAAPLVRVPETAPLVRIPEAAPLVRVPEAAPLLQAPDAAPLRQLQLGSHSISYLLRRSTRRSIGFMIDDDGLRVTAPRRIALAEIDNAIRAKQGWILNKLRERQERRAQRLQCPPMLWLDGAALPYLGGAITLRLHQAARHRASFNPHTLELHVWQTPVSGEQHLKERVRAWLQQDARRLFAERLDLYAARLGVSYHSFALSSAGTRWGSCTMQRKIRLNWRLVHFPLALIDYVVAHELSHLLEMNHGPRFWATVESVYPDYDGARMALRKRAQELPLLFA